MMDAVGQHKQMIGTKPACEALGVTRSTYYRRRVAKVRKSPTKPRPTPARALAVPERKRVLTLLHSERFMDQSPGQIVATLLDEEKYLCSERTMYRILAAENEVRERRNQLRHPNYKQPELLATGPNRVWSWDITKLRGPIKWTYFHLYVVLDIYSRYVVGWLLAHRESTELAKRLVSESCAKQGIEAGQLTIHADRGAAMKSKGLAQLITDLGVDKSHSRPHVSNDNPFSESQFKTLKYRPEYPNRFGSFEDALAFCRRFFAWYNTQHRHSGIKMLTPEMVHYGQAEEILTKRHRVMLAAEVAHPERFVRGTPRPVQAPTAVWINPPRSLVAMDREAVELVIPQHQPSQEEEAEASKAVFCASSSSMEALH
jgi:putative transposase